MSKKLTVLALASATLSLFATSQNMIGNQTQNEGIFAVPKKSAVVVDGDFKEWDLSGQIQSYMDTSIKDTFSVKSAAMWDEDYLYLAFDWLDPYPLHSTVDPKFDPTRGWTADAIQLRIRAGEQVSWATFWCFNGNQPSGDIAYWQFPTNKGEIETVQYMGKPNSIELGDGILSAYKMGADKKSFTHEMRIPWKQLFRKDKKMSANEKIQMGMEFVWGTAAGSGWPMHRYADNMAKGHTSREFFWSALNSWGDVTLSADSVEKRQYIASVEKMQGTIPIKVEVPTDAKTFTVVIEDMAGKRIRNLAGGFDVNEYMVKDGEKTKTVEVMWNGLDDTGKLVAPGEYKVRGLTQSGLEAFYEMSFYSPGTPAWQTSNNRGAWGADHSPFEIVNVAGDNIILAAHFAEGGFGTIAVGPDGKKVWGEKKGASLVASNNKYVFTTPNDWSNMAGTILRLDAQTGKFAPFIIDGKESILPYPLANLLPKEAAVDGKIPVVKAMLADDDKLIFVLENNQCYVLDPETANVKGSFELKIDSVKIRAANTVSSSVKTTYSTIYPIAMAKDELYYLSDNKLNKFNVQTLEKQEIELFKESFFSLFGVSGKKITPEVISAIALDKKGNIYIADNGKIQQVQKFSPKGKLLKSYGDENGRPREGKYNKNGFANISSIALDKDDNVWVVEFNLHPRRTSVWSNNGSLIKEYIGNTGYSGQGTFAHDNDPTKVFAEYNELKISTKDRTCEVENIMWDRDIVPIPGVTAVNNGNAFFSDASGEKHEYFVTFGDVRNTPFSVLLKDKGQWKMVSAILSLANFQSLLGGHVNAQMVKEPYGEFAGCDPADMLIWNDQNDDGAIQKAECDIVPASIKTRYPNAQGKNGKNGVLGMPGVGGWSNRIDQADFSFYSSRTENKDKNLPAGLYRYTPDSFKPNGAPVYSAKSWKRIGEAMPQQSFVPIKNKDYVVGFMNPRDGVKVYGMKKADGEILWTYPSPFHGVHGSHKATMPKAGLLIGPLQIAGVVNSCGDASEVFMMRGNLGQDFYMTSDGLYVDSMFRDTRLPSLPFPDTEEDLRKINMNIYTGGAEHFSGWISRQDDGVVRMTGGFSGQSGLLTRIEGLESIRYFNNPNLKVTSSMLVTADQFNAQLTKKSQAQNSFTIPLLKGALNWSKIKGFDITRQGQVEKCNFKTTYDSKNLYLYYSVSENSPWKNSGKDFGLLFKTGDSVDFMISPSKNRAEQPKVGDVRILMSNLNNKNIAVAMRPKVTNKVANEKRVFSSPVATYEFDQVKVDSSVKLKVNKRSNGYTVEATIPWTSLGITPKAGATFTGDVGFILSDMSGQINAARVYWANKNTNLVSDIPHEAILKPNDWGVFTLGK